VLEYVEHAYNDVIQRVFRVCHDHKMYSVDRCNLRIHKFNERGYINITNIVQARMKAIDDIINGDGDGDSALFINTKKMYQ